MTAREQHDGDRPREPLIEERGDGTSPTIAQAGDDMAKLVVGDRRAHDGSGDNGPSTDRPAGSA